MHYFKDRTEAGDEIAKYLKDYRHKDTIVLGLSPGGVMVGAEIARRLHALITMLMVKDVFLPDGQTLVGQINEIGGFVHNNAFSAMEIEEFEQEYHATIEAAKMQAIHDMHVALGEGGLISKEYFRNRVVIVVSDGASSGAAFEAADHYLRMIKTKKVVMVTPMAGVRAIDRMHLLADQMICLNTTEEIYPVNHYYAKNDLPNRREIIQLLNTIVLSWYQDHKDIPIMPVMNAVTGPKKRKKL